MILVNVLMFVAIASGLVLLMINREELALDTGLRTREAARAQAIVRGGEVSAIVALRRDAETAGDVDHAAEPWAQLAEKDAAIEGGSFSLAISDAEGRFNINSIRGDDVGAIMLFHTIANAVGLDQGLMMAASEYVREHGPIADLRPLRAAGIAPEVADRLERLVTALPGKTSLNLNAADQEMLHLLFRDPVVAERLVQIRQARGYLTRDDLTAQNMTMPHGATFKSSHFWVRTQATVGGTKQQGTSLIQRRQGDDGRWDVVPVARWRGAAVPPGAPALP